MTHLHLLMMVQKSEKSNPVLDVSLQPFTFMPWYTWVFVESIQYNNISFPNDER